MLSRQIKVLYQCSPEEVIRKIRHRWLLKYKGLENLELDDYFRIVPNGLSWGRHLRNFHRVEKICANRCHNWSPMEMEGKVFLEIGCGLAGGLSPMALFRGAEKVLLVEPLWREGVFENKWLQEAYFRPLWSELVTVYGKLMSFDDWMNRLRKDIEVHVGGMETCSFSLEPDLSWSLSCLEHVPDLAGGVRQLRKVFGSKKGRQMHVVDFGNHMSKDFPFRKIYEEPAEDYLEKSAKEINLLRMSDVVELFEAEGWDCDPIAMTRAKPEPERISNYWKEKYPAEVLEIRVAVLLIN